MKRMAEGVGEGEIWNVVWCASRVDHLPGPTEREGVEERDEARGLTCVRGLRKHIKSSVLGHVCVHGRRGARRLGKRNRRREEDKTILDDPNERSPSASSAFLFSFHLVLSSFSSAIEMLSRSLAL